MSKLDKSALKAIFKEGAVPTEAQFASLIDSQVNLEETGNPTESVAIDFKAGFMNISGSQPFYGIITPSPLTGSNAAFGGGIAIDIGQPLPNSPFIKTNGGFDILMDNANTYTNSEFRVWKDTGVAGVGGNELLNLNDGGVLSVSSSYVKGNITASGNISASGTIRAGAGTTTGTLVANLEGNVTGNVTASGAISASGILTAGNLVVGGTSTLNGDITIPNPVKLYLGGTSGMHVYSEGTSTDENQIILAKTNNLRILNQAHGKDIIFGTENASGTAKTPLTLNGDGNAVFGGSITSADDLSLTSDSSIFNMGAGNDFSITHDGTTGATIRATPLTLTSGTITVLSATSTSTTSSSTADTTPPVIT